MKIKTAVAVLLCVCVPAVILAPDYTKLIAAFTDAGRQTTVAIDPGHGGMDGGAVSAEGTCEKDINLDIALLLKKRLEADGINTVMTRKNDKGLYGRVDGRAIRSLKTEDMYARKRIIDGAGASLTVSIHLNSFMSDPGVKGAQVFYPTEGEADCAEKSRTAAEIIQKNLNRSINGSSPRTELGKNDVFLLRNVKTPTVIAECGFLSNNQDADMLKKGAAAP